MKKWPQILSAKFAFVHLCMLLTLCSGKLEAQTDMLNGLPEKVLISFRERYSQVDAVTWIQQQNAFVGDYQLKGIDHRVWMSAEGKVLKHAVRIEQEYLPLTVKQQLYKTYPTCKILSIYQIDVNKKNTYQVRIKNGREKVDLLFDSKGRNVKS